MKIKAFCLLFSLTILQSLSIAQTLPQGLFSEKPVYKYGSNYILELTGNKFYNYFLPGGMGTIIIKTGTWSITDSIIALQTDTTAAFSLNVYRLVRLSINCDSIQYMTFSEEDKVITFSQEYEFHPSDKTVRLDKTTESDIILILERYGGLTLDLIRHYLNPPDGFEIKKCRE
jgi:hypothetical protein